MGKPERGKQPKGDAPALDEDLDIRTTLQQLLVNTKGIPDMNTEMNELKTQIKKTNDVLIPALKGQISTLEKGIKELTGDVEVQDARIEDVEDRCSKLEAANIKLQEEVRKLKDNPTQHAEKANDKIIEDRVQIALRRFERQTHLLIDGIAENPNENIFEQVGLVLHDTQLNLERSTVLKVYRLGTLNEKSWRPRPVVVEFDCRETRDLVFKARFNIKTNPNCEKVWINERLDDEQRLQRMELRALADLAKEKKREARVVGETLIVSGIKYKHADLDKLPDEVNLEEAFTRVDGEYIYFNSEHSFLSAFYPVEFTYKKQTYQTAEQAHAHRKAKGNNHLDIAKQILQQSNPRKCKQLAKGLTTSQTWRDNEDSEIEGIQAAKFSIPVLKNKLIETGNKTLVECTGDRKWGCGCPYNSNQRKEKTWQGQNKFGLAVMHRRDLLAAEQTTDDTVDDGASDSSTETHDTNPNTDPNAQDDEDKDS